MIATVEEPEITNRLTKNLMNSPPSHRLGVNNEASLEKVSKEGVNPDHRVI